MKRIYTGTVILSLLFILFTAFQPSPDEMFWASTPCDTYLKERISIAPGVNCEFMKWKLTLSHENKWSAEVNYGESQPNTTGFKQGGLSMVINGSYTSSNGFYTLTSSKLKAPFFLRKISPDLLHFTDDEKKLLTGNAGYSYTLNRTK